MQLLEMTRILNLNFKNSFVRCEVRVQFISDLILDMECWIFAWKFVSCSLTVLNNFEVVLRTNHSLESSKGFLTKYAWASN
jgi:hypothetical protein